MLVEWQQTRFKAEVALLLGLAFFLPLLEAPKNLTWLGYASAWFVNRIRARDFGGRWDGWDTMFALWIGSGFVVAMAARFHEFHGGEWGGAMDLLRYVSIAWLVKRARYDAHIVRWALLALIASTILGLVVGYVRLWTGIGKSGTLQLYSVGHVNHSAIYIAIMLGVCAGWVFAGFAKWSGWQRAAAVLALSFVFASLVVTASRAAFAAGVLALLILSFAWWKRWRVPAIAVLLATVVAIGTAAVLRMEIIAKQERYEAMNVQFSQRDSIWRVGLEAWKRHPWLGVGMDNYAKVTVKHVEAWRAEDGKPFDPSRYVVWAHGHSLFVSALAERGVVGSAVLLAVLAGWLLALTRYRPHRDAQGLEWAAWAAATSGWTVTVAVGIFNTTLHHEHGILASLLLGLWLGSLRHRSNQPSHAQ